MRSRTVEKVEWRVQLYSSGSHTIQCYLGEYIQETYLHISGPDNIIYSMCKELRDFLNGARRPLWLDDLELKDDILLGGDGTTIIAIGPEQRKLILELMK